MRRKCDIEITGYMMEEAKRRREEIKARDARVVKAVMDNLDSDYFDFDSLCQRFATLSYQTISGILHKHGIWWGTDDQWHFKDRSKLSA